MKLNKIALILAATLYAASSTHAATEATAGAGAGGATTAAMGTTTSLAIAAGVVVAVAAIAGDGGSAAVVSPADDAAGNAVDEAAAVQAAAATLETKVNAALSTLGDDGSADYDAVSNALATASYWADIAKTDADNLAAAAALGTPVPGAVCAASPCTQTEFWKLSYKAAQSAKYSAEAALSAAAQLKAYAAKFPGKDVSGLIEAALNAGLAAQKSANTMIADTNKLSKDWGISGTVLSASSGTVGTVTGTN